MTFDLSAATARRCSRPTTASTGGTRAPTFVFNISPNATRGGGGIAGPTPTTTTAGSRAKKARWTERAAASPTESLDPNLENTLHQEIATFVERELMPNFGVRAGYVWRGERNHYGAHQHRPAVLRRSPCRSAVPDPGPDGRVGTVGRWRADRGIRSGAADIRALPPVNHARSTSPTAMAISTPSKSPAPSA